MLLDYAWVIAGVTALGSIAYTARNALTTAWGYLSAILIVTVDMDECYPNWAIDAWLKSRGKRVQRTQTLMCTEWVKLSEDFFARHKDRYEPYASDRRVLTAFEVPAYPAVWLLDRWKPLWLTGSNSGKTDNGAPGSRQPGVSSSNVLPASSAMYGYSKLRFIRGTLDIHEVMSGVECKYTSTWAECWKHSRFVVVRITGSAEYQRFGRNSDDVAESQPSQAYNRRSANVDVDADKTGRSEVYGFDLLKTEPVTVKLTDVCRELPKGSRLSDIWLCDDLMDVYNELEFWKDSRVWYATRGVAWQRRYGLVGAPGNGKSAFIRAAAGELGVPVYLFDLASLSNAELINGWTVLRERSPCIAVLEDIDRVFNGSRNIIGTPLSFDCLLNVLDGIDQVPGVAAFITSNRPELLDEALMIKRPDGSYVARPGRVDRIIECPPPDETGRRKIAQRIMVDLEQHVEALVVSGAGDSGAQFQQRCFREAEKLHWLGRTKNERIRDERSERT